MWLQARLEQLRQEKRYEEVQYAEEDIAALENEVTECNARMAVDSSVVGCRAAVGS